MAGIPPSAYTAVLGPAARYDSQTARTAAEALCGQHRAKRAATCRCTRAMSGRCQAIPAPVTRRPASLQRKKCKSPQVSETAWWPGTIVRRNSGSKGGVAIWYPRIGTTVRSRPDHKPSVQALVANTTRSTRTVPSRVFMCQQSPSRTTDVALL